MAKITLVQETNDIYIMVKNLLEIRQTKLSKVCEKHGIHYGTTIKELKKNSIDLDYLKDLINKIDPEAKVSIDVSISLFANGKEIFNQTTEK